jgi:hypothetical protein
LAIRGDICAVLKGVQKQSFFACAHLLARNEGHLSYDSFDSFVQRGSNKDTSAREARTPEEDLLRIDIWSKSEEVKGIVMIVGLFGWVDLSMACPSTFIEVSIVVD